MFDLKIYNENEFTVKIPGTNQTLTVFYRTPNSAERIEFRSTSFNLIGKNQNEDTIKKQLEFQLDYGMKFITGILENDFSYDGVPISSNEKSEFYRADWKELLKNSASFVIEKFVDVVFGYAVVEENPLPFVKK